MRTFLVIAGVFALWVLLQIAFPPPQKRKTEGTRKGEGATLYQTEKPEGDPPICIPAEEAKPQELQTQPLEDAHPAPEGSRSIRPESRRTKTRHGEEVDLEELIQTCEHVGYDNELLRALVTAGDYERVISLCRERLGDSSYGSLALARTLFILGDYLGALEEWEKFPFKTWKQEGERWQQAFDIALKDGKTLDDPFLLRLMDRRFADLPHLWTLCRLRKYDCIASLICLREVLGRSAVECEQVVFLNYPLIYECVAQTFNDWKQALAVLDLRYATEEAIRKLRERFKNSFRPSTSPEALRKAHLKYGPVGEENYQEFMRVMNDVRALWKRGRFSEAAALSKSAYDDNPFDSSMRSGAASDAYLRSLLLAGEFGQYVEARRSRIVYRGPDLFDPYLNAVLLAGDKLRAVDIAFWDTPFLNRHRESFHEYVEAQLTAFEEIHGVDILRHAARTSTTYTRERAVEIMLVLDWIYRDSTGWTPLMNYTWQHHGELLRAVLRHSPLALHLGRIYRICEEPNFKAALPHVRGANAGEAEELLRGFLGVPLRGEGWVSQHEVYVLLRSGFAPLEVQREASPVFLAGLRYDIYVPELRLAVEYQGIQHFEPVEAFGGEEALQEVRARDAAKARLSEINGVQLEYIRYDEDLRQRCEEIIAKYKPS